MLRDGGFFPAGGPRKLEGKTSYGKVRAPSQFQTPLLPRIRLSRVVPLKVRVGPFTGLLQSVLQKTVCKAVVVEQFGGSILSR